MLPFQRLTVALLAIVIFAAEARGQGAVVTSGTLVARADPANVAFVDDSDDAIHFPARLLIRQEPLEAALSQLYRAAGIPLLFSPSLIPTGHKVDCDCMAVTVGEALELLLADTGLDFISLGGQVIIAPAAPEPDASPPIRRVRELHQGDVAPGSRMARAGTWMPRTVQIQNGTVSGRVIENLSRQPLASVQVFLPRLRIGTLTDASGRFILPNVPPGTHQLRAERIGFQPATAQVTVRSAATATVDLTMSEQALALDEIIVTGTAGQARRREVGNSITRIDVVRLDKGGRTDPTPNLDQLLQAQGPGISVVQSGQSIGSGSRIRLRGDNSVAMGNQPLLFIDGIRMHNNSPPTNTPIDGSGARGAHVHVSPMNDINPDDIERIEIIKGAAATTLYGTEASSGVIQIFTKRGKTGGTVWSAQVDYGLDTPRKFAPEPEPYMRLDCCFRTGQRKRLAVSVAGGTDALRYFISGGFQGNTGILPVDSQQVVNLRGNFSIRLTEKLTLDYNTGWTHNFMRHTPAGNNSQGLTTIAFRDKGSSIGADWRDRIEEIYKWEITNDHNHVVTGLTANYAVTEKLSNRLTVGVDRLSAEMRNVRPFGFIVDPIGIVNNGQWGQQNITFDFASNLALQPRSDFSATLSAGAQLLRKAEFTVNAYSDNLPGPGVPTVSSGARFLASERRQKEVTGGGFGQALLGFKDRFFLTLGLRVDGSSAFGENFGFQPYPKASLAYVVSEEGFWPDALGDVKLRAAYGHAGRAPGAFDAGRTWQPVGFGGAPAFYPDRVGNPDLGPERTAEIELGFDATLFGGRGSIEFTAYNQTVSDALFPVSQSPSLGFSSSQLMNVGKVGNKGLELGLKATPIEAGWGGWDLGVSLTSQKNKVLDLGGAPETGSIRLNESVPVVIGTKLMNRDELAEPRFVTDFVFGPRQPTKMFAISSSLRLPRGIELSGRGEFMGGHFITIGGIGQTASRRAWPECEVRAYEYLASGRRRELTAYEILMCDTALPGGSFPETYAADFFRVRDISLRFPVPTRIIGAASVTISARNYWTKFFKDWFFADPEILARGGEGTGLETLGGGIGEDTPPPRMFTVSVKTTF